VGEKFGGGGSNIFASSATSITGQLHPAQSAALATPLLLKCCRHFLGNERREIQLNQLHDTE